METNSMLQYVAEVAKRITKDIQLAEKELEAARARIGTARLLIATLTAPIDLGEDFEKQIAKIRAFTTTTQADIDNILAFSQLSNRGQ